MDSLWHSTTESKRQRIASLSLGKVFSGVGQLMAAWGMDTRKVAFDGWRRDGGGNKETIPAHSVQGSIIVKWTFFPDP